MFSFVNQMIQTVYSFGPNRDNQLSDEAFNDWPQLLTTEEVHNEEEEEVSCETSSGFDGHLSANESCIGVETDIDTNSEDNTTDSWTAFEDRVNTFGAQLANNSNTKDIECLSKRVRCLDYNNRVIRCDPSQYRRRMLGSEHTCSVVGERVWAPNKHVFETIAKYPIPQTVWTAVDNNYPIDRVVPEFKQPLDKRNYQRIMHSLVYLEECENQINIRQYDMQCATLRPEGRYLCLTIDGLTDGRPSLIISDKIVVFDVNSDTAFDGYIHEIRRDEVMLRFNDDFHQNFSGGLFKVLFQINRSLYRRCHHAIDIISLSDQLVEQVLFPTKILIREHFKRILVQSIEWFNPSLNKQQKVAVVGVLRAQIRPTPYIIFGPPGTGKTVTIVESILQVWHRIPESRVIVCTSANSCADLIALKLLESGRITASDLIRITALYRVTNNTIPENVRIVTQTAVEDKNKWLNHRILVTTTSTAGVIFKHNTPLNHFTHVFIDEAAQTMEPEVLIPISLTVMSGNGVVVLAGDHKQLGPVVLSQKAKANRLHYSLLERLMTSFKPYFRDEEFEMYGSYNPKFVTKLVHNYRSNAIIMSIPSEMFYENELKFNNKINKQLIQSLNCKSALNFIGVKGVERQDPDHPSWYNPQEAIQTCASLQALYKVGVQPQDIGIITPYRKQVLRIRNEMRGKFLNKCKIGTIEEFQGLEKRVIIISMVRALVQNFEDDIRYRMDFLHNPKRFNVAVSRAMDLLICIGDPDLLSRDTSWNQLIEYCMRNQSYSGCRFRDYIPKTN